MKKHFVNITKKLKVKPTETKTYELILSEILDRCKDHQINIKILSQMNEEKNLFSFKPVTSEEVLKTIYSLKNNKGSLFQLHYSSQIYKCQCLCKCLAGRFYLI